MVYVVLFNKPCFYNEVLLKTTLVQLQHLPFNMNDLEDVQKHYNVQVEPFCTYAKQFLLCQDLQEQGYCIAGAYQATGIEIDEPTKFQLFSLQFEVIIMERSLAVFSLCNSMHKNVLDIFLRVNIPYLVPVCQIDQFPKTNDNHSFFLQLAAIYQPEPFRSVLLNCVSCIIFVIVNITTLNVCKKMQEIKSHLSCYYYYEVKHLDFSAL